MTDFEEWFSSGLLHAVLLVAVIGSLIARRRFADRVWFVLAVPVVFAFFYCVCVMAVGAIFGKLLSAGGIVAVSGGFCLVAYVAMVASMAKDRFSSSGGYSLGKNPGTVPLQRETTKLDKIPTRRTWAGL